MANVLKRDRQMAVLHLLTEGSSIRATERITGVHRDTICRLVVRFGNRCREFMDEQMHGLKLTHLQVDEQWTFVGKKQDRLTIDERAECWDVGDIFLWTVLDKETKLVPTFALGKRSADNARRFMVDVRSRLAPLGTLDYPTVQISTDGFAAYPEAVDLAFGTLARYGVIIKEFRNVTMNYTPSEMVRARRYPHRAIIGNQKRSICTSHVERHNLTNRTFMKRFNRLTICFSKKLENLAAACGMYLAFYNYCWCPRWPGSTSRKRPAPAMAAGLTLYPWTFAELFDTVMPAKQLA